jgi:hypothetical protein
MGSRFLVGLLGMYNWQNTALGEELPEILLSQHDFLHLRWTPFQETIQLYDDF